MDASHEYTRRSERIRGRANERVPIVCTRRRRRRRRRRRQRGRTAIVRATTLPNGSLKDESCRVIFAPMIVERIRRRRRRLRARKGESTHIDSRDDASQKANTSPRRTGVRADARVREPRFCTRARARLIKWSVTHVFPCFFLPFFFWVLGVGCSIQKRCVHIIICVLCVCVYIQRGHSGKPLRTQAPIPLPRVPFGPSSWRRRRLCCISLCHLSKHFPPKNGKTVVRAPTSDVRVVSKASRRRTKQSGRTVENVYVHISY